MFHLFALAGILSLACGQIPIPSREVGYVYKHGSDSAPVHLDAYIDLICPDSEEALPALLQVADFYGPSQLQLTAHLFPLPYHRNSFYATKPENDIRIYVENVTKIDLQRLIILKRQLYKGAHAIAQLTKGNMTFEWISLVYKNMPNLVNSATSQFSEDQMKQKFGELASSLGLGSETFVPLLDDPNVEEDTRVAWKYACTRGVAATPTFMVNDVVVGASPSWTVDQWKQLIDSVLNPSKTSRTLTFKPAEWSSCAPNTRRCEYLPGKIECCTSGEACIPNVGCRC